MAAGPADRGLAALLWRDLSDQLPADPFGLQVRAAVQRLIQEQVDPASLPPRLRLFGISALAPVQVELIQALSGLLEVEVYLLTPCPDLWQRCGSRRDQLGGDWLGRRMGCGWRRRHAPRRSLAGWGRNSSSCWKGLVMCSWGSGGMATSLLRRRPWLQQQGAGHPAGAAAAAVGGWRRPRAFAPLLV